MRELMRKFYITLTISIKGGSDMKYITTILKYLGKAIETFTVLDPLIRGIISIWKPKKKSKTPLVNSSKKKRRRMI